MQSSGQANLVYVKDIEQYYIPEEFTRFWLIDWMRLEIRLRWGYVDMWYGRDQVPTMWSIWELIVFECLFNWIFSLA